MNKSLKFFSIIEACGLLDIRYSEQHYTWCNQGAEEARVWKRLDRAMVHDKWLVCMPQTTITHLPSVGSDHCPLYLEMKVRLDKKIKYFKFLHCWTETSGDPMWKLHQIMKKLASTLSIWYKEFGNIFSTVADFENQVKNAEENVIQHNSEEN